MVKVNTKKLSTQWLGRELNRQFYNDIIRLPGVDPCGEGGEYHTCITDGPIFKDRIRILRGEHSVEGDFGYFSIKDFEVKSK